MKKHWKVVSAIAVSTALVCGASALLAGCGKGGGKYGDSSTITVKIFCGASDADANNRICQEWAKSYGEKIGKEVKVNFDSTTNKKDYYDTMNQKWGSNDNPDIIYVSPSYVKSYVETGKIIDLTDYLEESERVKSAGVWKNSISYYGYVKGEYDSYKMGQAIHYDSASHKYVTDAEVDGSHPTVGVYALPKDYSNFSTGYNKKYFSEQLKVRYTTLKADEQRKIKGAIGSKYTKADPAEYTSKLTYTENSGKVFDDEYGETSVVRYAVTGDYYNPYTKQTMHATEGESAPLINVGVPTTYYPYNFYRYSSFQAAYDGGDPMAALSKGFGGYTVTIPGFPDDFDSNSDILTDEIFKAALGNAAAKDLSAPYDTGMLHLTYTYAEYSAMIWAVTYFLNTFQWDHATDPCYGGNGTQTGGNGGIRTLISGLGANAEYAYRTLYGGEQFEGVNEATTGSSLYLLPWLASNDADLIDETSRYCAAVDVNNNGVPTSFKVAANANFGNEPEKWREKLAEIVGTMPTTTHQKLNLQGVTSQKTVQYGYNSENFIETYGAFLALASDWNANKGGDADETIDIDGWELFLNGRSIFYGAGSWDMSKRNDSDTINLQFGQIPTPVAEKYALYSSVKGANYERATYSNDPAAAAEDAQRSGITKAKPYSNKTLDSAGLEIYYKAANDTSILQNQVRRQDKWAARMDSVGYAANKKNMDRYLKKDEHKWKVAACASLIAALTIDEQVQKTLTYAGAQLPNFMGECSEFLYYNDPTASYWTTAGKTYDQGWFADMLTPEGFRDTPAGEGKAVWDHYYGICREIASAAKADATKGDTLKEYLTKNNVTGYKGEALRYNTEYDNVTIGSFTGEKIGFAMKVFNMVNFTRADRDINLRMQYGLNSVRDSSMYTYTTTWMSILDARLSPDNGVMFPYRNQEVIKPKTGSQLATTVMQLYSTYIMTNPSRTESDYLFKTPLVYTLQKAKQAQDELSKAYDDELTEIWKVL